MPSCPVLSTAASSTRVNTINHFSLPKLIKSQCQEKLCISASTLLYTLNIFISVQYLFIPPWTSPQSSLWSSLLNWQVVAAAEPSASGWASQSASPLRPRKISNDCPISTARAKEARECRPGPAWSSGSPESTRSGSTAETIATCPVAADQTKRSSKEECKQTWQLQIRFHLLIN